MDQAVNKPIPAATLIVMREGGGAPQYLVVRRALSMAFAPGAYVFPGGRIDEDDDYLGRICAPALDPADAAARVAAIRETLEETGLAVGIAGIADGDAAALRSRILDGDLFSAALEDAGARLDLDCLHAYSRWWPAHRVERIFDTRFYLAHADNALGEQDEIVVDPAENSHALWIAAQELIAMADSGDARIIFPTRANLVRLAQYSDLRSAMADIAAFPSVLVQPAVAEAGDGRRLHIPDDIGYPLTSVAYDD